MNAAALPRWSWKALPNGAVILVDGDGHTVMDSVRRSMQACVPRFPNWPGVDQGQPRAGRPGVMSMAQSWIDASGQLTHPYARLIATAPALLTRMQRAVEILSAEGYPVTEDRAVIAAATGSAQ